MSLSVADMSAVMKEKIDPVLKELRPIPPGPWDCGEMLPWLVHTMLVLMKASRLFGQLALQQILSQVSGMDRRASEQAGGIRCCPCPSCSSLVWSYDGTEMHHKAFKSLFGWVSVWRHYARCSCGKHFFPLDAILGLGSHKMCPLLQICCVYLGVHVPHSTASQLLELLTGIYVCPNTIAARVREMGQAVIKRQEKDVTLEVEKLLEFASGSEGVVNLHASLDGIMVHENELPKESPGSHIEVRMACVSVRDAEQTRLGKIVLGRLNALEVFLGCIERLLTDCRESMDNLGKIYLHADGAPWIENFAKAQDCLSFILDWYHLKEKLWKLSEALDKDMTAHRQQRIKAVEDALWSGNVGLATSWLKEMRFARPQQRKVRDDIVQYIWSRKDFIPNYKWLWERSFTIGSGEIEGAAKHVVSNRLKGAGMRWSSDGADQVIAARCTILNETWGTDLIGANLN